MRNGQDTFYMPNMKGNLAVVLTLFFVCCVADTHCFPYHYEVQLLDKVMRLEHRLEKLEETVNKRSQEVPEQICFQCPDAWIRFKESCYLFVAKLYPFQEARSNCRRRGADLVHINDFPENDFIRQHLRNIKGSFYWFGLEDISSEGSFKWVDDNTSPSFTFLYTDQPDNGAGLEDCAHFSSSYDYFWNDSQCSQAYMSICEMKEKN